MWMIHNISIARKWNEANVITSHSHIECNPRSLSSFPHPKKIQTSVPVSMTSTTTFSGVGFLKDIMTEERWPMHALMLVGSISWGGRPVPERLNIHSVSCRWNMPLFTIWQVRSVHFKAFCLLLPSSVLCLSSVVSELLLNACLLACLLSSSCKLLCYS